MTLFAIVGKVVGKTALTEVTKRVVEHGDSWISERLGEQLPTAHARSQQNAAEFVLDLDARLKRIEAIVSDPKVYADRVTSSLADPDVVEAVKGALVAGARTSSGERHRTIANIVSERLALETDSAKAAASQLALDVVTHLGAEHLALLGLLALIHVARPESDPEPIVNRDLQGTDASSDHWQKLTERGARFIDWFRQRLEIPQFPQSRMPLIAHLVSASCVIFEPEVQRDLEAALGPLSRKPPPSPNQWPSRGYGAAVAQYLGRDAQGRSLAALWRTDLQYLTPTPAGMLIGLAVHDAKTGDSQVSRWEWSAESLYIETKRPDTDRLLQGNFDDVVWDAWEERVKRIASTGGPLPWKWIR